MKTTTLLVACGILSAGVVCSVFADESKTPASSSADLNQTASAPEVKTQLDQPDGAAIFIKPDGSFQILAKGTGTYDFDDVDDVNDARKEGILKAKAALAKFMKESLSTEDAFAEASKKVKSITTDGKTQTANVSKESIKTNATLIRNSADALLKGVITLKEQKVPSKGSSGQIQVTVGVSSKTLKAVGKLVNALDATPEQGQAGASGASSATQTVDGNNNKAETREAVSDF